MHSSTTELTKARIAAIHDVWEAGMSAKRIAEKLAAIEGQFVSRMVVIGIYKRNAEYLKDVPLPPPSRETFGPRRERKAHQKRAYTKRVIKIKKPRTTNVLPFVIPDTAFTYVATHPTKRLYQLEAHECRWPMNGKGFDTQFCSQHAEGTYCDHHRLLSVGHGTKSERNAHKALRKMA